jgi:hypothetical protein
MIILVPDLANINKFRIPSRFGSLVSIKIADVDLDPYHCLNEKRVSDPHHFNADPGSSFSLKVSDPDPGFHLNVDPDPDPVPHQRNANLRPLAYSPFKYPF